MKVLCTTRRCNWHGLDEPGCWEPSSCGTPTAGVYRRTCWAHRPDAALGKKVMT